jgi:hypothetical protein
MLRTLAERKAGGDVRPRPRWPAWESLLQGAFLMSWKATGFATWQMPVEGTVGLGCAYEDMDELRR